MTTIKIEINSCQECPHFKKVRRWGEDSWDEAYDWLCKAAEEKK